ncbi:MAG: hypothetical protein H5U37_03695 [Caldisericia bacterium]|nr:hypothetical protein [Caldisericia bacterium]
MNEYETIRKELLSLKEKNVSLAPKILSKIISQKINRKKTKKIVLTFTTLSISLLIILLLRRRS